MKVSALLQTINPAQAHRRVDDPGHIAVGGVEQ